MKTRSRVAVVATVAIASASILGIATAASAHNFVVSTTPAEGSTLTELPERFDITTNDALLDVTGNADAFFLDIRDTDGLYYGDGCVAVEGTTMFTDAALGEPGTYTIAYQLVSADGHSVSDEYTFEWAPDGEQTVSRGWSLPPECGVEREPDLVELPNVAPSADPSAEPTATPEAPESPSSGIGPELLWAGGAAAAIIAVVAAVLLLRRRR